MEAAKVGAGVSVGKDGADSRAEKVARLRETGVSDGLSAPSVPASSGFSGCSHAQVSPFLQRPTGRREGGVKLPPTRRSQSVRGPERGPAQVGGIRSTAVEVLVSGRPAVRVRKRRLTLWLLPLAFVACAHPHHIATVAVSSSYSITEAAEATERSLLCGVFGAPNPPLCVDHETHVKIRTLLKRAYQLEGGAASGLKATSEGAPVPAVELASLVSQALALIPESPAKAAIAPKVKP